MYDPIDLGPCPSLMFVNNCLSVEKRCLFVITFASLLKDCFDYPLMTLDLTYSYILASDLLGLIMHLPRFSSLCSEVNVPHNTFCNR